MKRLLILTLMIHAAVIANSPPQNVEQSTPPTTIQLYKAKDFSHLIGMPGFSDEALTMHFKLYNGYVTNTNLLLALLKQYAAEGKDRSLEYAELKRRLGWEFDGMRLHEDYFTNLGGKKSSLSDNSRLAQRINHDFGSYEKWKEDFIATGALRGIGWVILYLDPVTNNLLNIWVAEHDRGHLAGGEPILVMDVWEHAYLLDYALDRMDYIKAFFNNIDWDVVQKRYDAEIRKKVISRN